MTLKEELQRWAAALQAYDEEDFGRSLELFSCMQENSKILTNMGLIYATIGKHDSAVQKFIEATDLDQYLAVAYFQCGVSNFLRGRFQLALRNFEDAEVCLRGNQDIRYEQIGLKFVLHFAEILFNQGLSQIYLGRLQEGMSLLRDASAVKATGEHEVIDEAIKHQGDQYTVFSVPVGVLYRPNENKLRNAQAKDYLGKAKLIATSDSFDSHVEFTGAARLKQGIPPMGLLSTNPEQDRLSAQSRSGTAPTPRAALSQTLRAQSTENQQLTLYQSPANTTITRSKSSSEISTGKPSLYARGVSVRGVGDHRPRITSDVGPGHLGGQRHTAYYYERFDSYDASSSSSSLNPKALVKPDRTSAISSDRTAWTQRKLNTDPHGHPLQARSRNASTSYSSSLSGKMNRKMLDDRMSQSRASSVSEEEGYASWSEQDGDRTCERPKIRVKLHYRGDIRGMALVSNTRFQDFFQMVTQKFGSTNGLGLKFKDEDGGVISLKDESDYELAIETAYPRGARGSLEGKLEIWCADL